MKKQLFIIKKVYFHPLKLCWLVHGVNNLEHTYWNSIKECNTRIRELGGKRV